MDLLDKVKKSIDRFLEEYKLVVCKNKEYLHDFKELFSYTNESLDKVVYQSSGLVGLYRDCAYQGTQIIDKIDSISRKTFVGKEYTSYNPNSLSQMISLKNKYFWKTHEQLQDIILKEMGVQVKSIESLIKDAMHLKVTDERYKDISQINYDSKISSYNMKKDILEMYTGSDKTLKVIALDLEKKYGMHISASTISVHARRQLAHKGLNFKNRREAKKHFEH